jgi:hypothetical protein
VKNSTVQNTFKPNTGIIAQHPTKIESKIKTSTTKTSTSTTSTSKTSTSTTLTSTTTSTTTVPTTILTYGCARFKTAGDLYFNITEDNAEKCVSECLKLDDKFRFFITSFFLM